MNTCKMMKKKTQAKNLSVASVEYLSYMKNVYLTMFKLFRIIAQSVTFSSMLSNHFSVKQKLEISKCEIRENSFKTKDYPAIQGTTIHNKCHICGKVFKNNNTLTKHFVQ